MNENIDLTKILEGCPKGTELYSTIYGKVRFEGIGNSDLCPIEIKFLNKFTNPSLVSAFFAKDGRCSSSYDGECVLFPSKDQRDWGKFKSKKQSKFDPKALQPFDRVLVKNSGFPWRCDIFSYYQRNKRITCHCISDDYIYDRCIPYNDDTKHLVGTTKEAPEYYRYWEE